jgi:hypothetical protein
MRGFSMPIDIATEPAEQISREDLEFHPLVKAELERVLRTELLNLEQVLPDRLLKFQGRVEMLRWIMKDMLPLILETQRVKARAAEAKE